MIVTTRHKLLLLGIAIAVFALGSAVLRLTARKSINVLFIGNSYTYVNDMPSILEQISANNSESIHSTMAVAGGATLEMHWNNPQTRSLLRSRKWDVAVLQEQSMQPIGNPASFSQYAGLLANEARSSGAKVMLYMTWAREGSPEQQDDLTNAYRSVAANSCCRVAPVGEAWRIVRDRRSDIALFADDGSHPSPAGSYLTACVFYAAITGKTPVGISPLDGMTQDDSIFLQSTAWAAVKQEQE